MQHACTQCASHISEEHLDDDSDEESHVKMDDGGEGRTMKSHAHGAMRWEFSLSLEVDAVRAGGGVLHSLEVVETQTKLAEETVAQIF